MRYDKMRGVLKQHFAGMLEATKGRIAQDGRLNEGKVAFYGDTIRHIDDDSYFELMQGHAQHPVHSVIEKYDLPFKEGTTEYQAFKDEYKRSRASYCQEVLDYDASLDLYDLGSNGSESYQSTCPTQQDTTLELLIEKYVAERVRGGNWTLRTEKDYRSKFSLLCGMLPKDIALSAIDTATARRVKDTLQRAPKNLKTSPMTRGLSFQEALALENVARMDVKTINTHLAAYKGLFKWAEENSYVEKNVFAGLAIKQGKTAGKAREAFSSEQIELIQNTIIHNEQGLIKKKYQYWGPLIGLYTGARLNEIAQLELNDIRQEDGIWCFDINDQSEGKTLKTTSARRLVPIHSKLIELGFIKYVQTLRSSKKTRLLHELGYSEGTGYGRNLSRWFNGPFLKALGMDKQGLVFHSFRHTMNTNLLQSDVGDPLVKSILGHAQEGVTHLVYFKKGHTVAQKQQALEGLSWK
jgi:integrase